MASTTATSHRLTTIAKVDSSTDAVERAALPAYGLVFALMLFLAVTVIATDFAFDTPLLLPPALIIIGSAATGMHFRRNRQSPRFGSGLQAFALFITISLAAPFCAVIAASSNLPLADDWLAELDRTLFFGFERRHVVDLVVARPALMEAVQLVYNSLIWQPLLIGSIIFTMNPHRGWTLLFAWGLTLTMIIAIFPFFPAVGAPPYFLDFLGTFDGARNGTLRLLGGDALRGIVTFPSFHAAAAVLLAWGWAAVPRIGRALIIVNMLMIASALIAGHYLIDLVAGVLIAGIALACANALQRRLIA